MHEPASLSTATRRSFQSENPFAAVLRAFLFRKSPRQRFLVHRRFQHHRQSISDRMEPHRIRSWCDGHMISTLGAVAREGARRLRFRGGKRRYPLRDRQIPQRRVDPVITICPIVPATCKKWSGKGQRKQQHDRHAANHAQHSHVEKISDQLVIHGSVTNEKTSSHPC